MLDQLVRTTSIFVNRNSTTILTGFGIAGVVTTALLASKGTVQAMNAIFHEELKTGTASDRNQRYKERFAISWKFYIPAVSVGAVTIACIVGAHSIGAKKNAALASAYTLVNKAFGDYKGEVIERLGERKAQEITDSVVDKQIQQQPTSLVVLGDGDMLCWDAMTARYFESSPEKIRRAENQLNAQLLHGEQGVSINDLYSLLGLEHTAMGDDMGWNDQYLLDIGLSSHLTPDERPALAMTFTMPPFPKYWKVG